MKEHIEIPVTREQILEIKNITASTRYEALDKVANILGAKIGYRGTWGGTTRKTIVIDNFTSADITYSKGKVVDLSYYDHHKKEEDYVFYKRIDIKNFV